MKKKKYLHVLLDYLIEYQPGDGGVVRVKKLEGDSKINLEQIKMKPISMRV